MLATVREPREQEREEQQPALHQSLDERDLAAHNADLVGHGESAASKRVASWLVEVVRHVSELRAGREGDE
eukprot:7380577-Prymnesium_polylepis.3